MHACIHPSIYPAASLKTKQFGETSLTFEFDSIRTKLFCETSSILEVDNIKNEAILQDFLQKWKAECRADGFVPMRFAIFSPHLSKVLRLPGKSEARSYEMLRLSRKIIFPKLKICCSKMQHLSGNQRPDLLTSLMHMSLVLRRPRKMYLCRSSSNVPRLPSFLDMPQNPHVLLTFDKAHNHVQKWSEHVVFLTFWLRNVLRATTAYTFSTSQLPKVVRSWCVLYILAWKCASHHPNMVCFVDFDLQMCFAPQQRALFRHHNFHKWSDPGVFCACWLGNVLRATTACNFSSLIWPHGSPRPPL